MFSRKKVRPRITAKGNIHQVIASFIATRGNNRDWAILASELKNCGKNELISSSLERLTKELPATRKVILGQTFPKKIIELGNGENCYFFKALSIENEINWAIQYLRMFKEPIKTFVLLRDQVENAILLGNYCEAEKILESSLDKLGYSIWYYEMKLTIAGYQEKIEKSVGILSDVNTQKKEDKAGFVKSLLANIFNRSQKRVSALEYDSILYSKYKRNRTDFQNDRCNYFLFRLNYYQHFDIEDLSVIMIMENLNSIVDRYTTLMYLIRSYFVTSKKFNSAIRFGLRLYRIAEDKRLYPYLAYNDIKTTPKDYYNYNFIEILNKYYTGDYTGATVDCRRYLQTDPSNFDVVKIYCRSLLFLKKGYQSICSENEAPINIVAKNIFMVMTQKDHDAYLDRLYQLSKNLYGLHFAAGLDYFIKEERKVRRCNQLRLLYINWFDPMFANIFGKVSDREIYLKTGLENVPNSVAVNYQLKRIRKEVSDDIHVVEYIRKTDNAKIVFEKENYHESLKLWNNILVDNIDYIPTVQTAVDYIFKSYSKLGVAFRQKAVKFYVEKFIENRAFVSKVETDEFMELIKQTKYEGLKNDIDFLIFIFLNAQLYPQKEFVLQSYCKYEGVTYPSDLIEVFRYKDKTRVELFFYLILSDDILYHYYKLKSTLDVLDEKLKIVTYLKGIRPVEKFYSDLCTELMHELIAYRGMKKMNDSKIYVNVDAVMKYELNNIDELYERFKKQASLVKKNRIYFLVSDINVSDSDNSSEIIKDAVSYSDNAVAEVAMQLFDTIRHAFLKSRFGLGTYLSTRIRHGVFEGEMRSGLERLKIIFNTSGNTYITIPYWRNTYNIDSANNDILNSKIIAFSKNVDLLINKFKDTVIQIHENESDNINGDFNYAIPIEEISRKMLEFESKSTSSREFCLSVIDYLWEITENRLAEIRDKVQNELGVRYFELLGQLEKDIEPLSRLPKLYKDLHATINMAREEITAKITKVQNWFYRQETKFEDFQLEDHINMAIESTAKYLPDISYELTLKLESTNKFIKAEYSPSMFDMLTIFFNNMLQYGRKDGTCNILIESKLLENNIQLIHLENDLSKDTNEDELNAKFRTSLAAISSLQKEGGSGLVKAMNIIKYDFNNVNNLYNIEAKGGKCLIDIMFNLENMIKNDEDSVS